jgi:hypothetical protein
MTEQELCYPDICTLDLRLGLQLAAAPLAEPLS